MKKYKFLVAFAALAGTLSLQSCLDFDDPGAEFDSNTKNIEKITERAKVDSINYKLEITGDQAAAVIEKLQDYLNAGRAVQFSLRGGKNGETPGEHQYQFQFSLGIDNYAQYAVIPHQNFVYSKVFVPSTYAIAPKFYGGANGSFGEVRKPAVQLLNHSLIDSIPEMKAVYLLLFNTAALENADIYGPFAYQDVKTNKQSAPYNYDNLETIYRSIVENIDTAVACFNYFPNKKADYKEKLVALLKENILITNDDANNATDFETWKRFANSLKLRMAMHIVKVNSTLAKKWAEEAVKSGVIEDQKNEVALRPNLLGFTNPLIAITKWGDTRITASLVSLLESLKHPYVSDEFRLFTKNDNLIVNSKTNEKLEPDTKIVGIRSGTHTGDGQGYDGNQYIAFSGINPEKFHGVPLYIMKLSEVYFLRAEGALRGWNMGGSAEEFYNKGILAANCLDRQDEGNVDYQNAMAAYMAQEKATPYTYVDPTGDTENVESLTKIGVKWNAADPDEVKLEKIITQKYIAAYPMSFEAWVDLRRTGYPKLFEVLNVDESDGSLKEGDIIRRLPFPGRTDPATQADIQATGLKALNGADVVGTRLWWDVNAPNF
ncbi:MAG: SusD/RagB family nutrient-binding outer membrane lipoprotein [Prevotella sp.]